jgi:mannose-6-phosphate isomerase-like protein (cupin superfamily)
MNQPYIIRKASDVDPVPCPCGAARRIITGNDNDLVSVHRVSIHKAAKVHYHERLTEYYVILEGSGEIRLDDDRKPVGPGDVVMIPPGTRHALDGEFEIINIVSPPFDPADEHVVAEASG